MPNIEAGVLLDQSTVYLVSCVKTKRDHDCMARDMYISSLFLKSRAYVERTHCAWFILSAEYGLVRPSCVIAPYERTLNKMKWIDRQNWARNVVEDFDRAVRTPKKVVFLAGVRYREFLIPHFEDRAICIDVPMKHLSFGNQLKWLGNS